MTQEKLRSALDNIAKNPAWRNAFIRQLLALEKQIATPDLEVRELVTGPLVDALFSDNEVVRKSLANGTVLDFYYRSKIARDFVMSEPEVPTHAWEPQTTRLLVNLAKTAKQALIGGAYFGDHAILIAQQVARNQGQVHAFEPNDDQRNMLVHNAKLNNLTNIVARPEGLWDNSTSSLQLVGDDSFASSEAIEGDATGGIRTVTVEDYLGTLGVSQLDLIMLDIEGAELRVLLGAQKYLAAPAGEAPAIVFEVHRHYVDWSDGLVNTEIVKLLTGFGYKIFALRDFNSNVDLSKHRIELIPVASVHLGELAHGFNMVAVKDDKIFDAAEYSLCKDVSPKLLRHRDPALHHPIGGL